MFYFQNEMKTLFKWILFVLLSTVACEGKIFYQIIFHSQSYRRGSRATSRRARVSRISALRTGQVQ